MMSGRSDLGEWRDDESLVRAQQHWGTASPPYWTPPVRPLVAAGCFVAFFRGEAGPGKAGDRAFAAAAVVVEDGPVLNTAVVVGSAGATYVPGLLGRREGALLLAALRALPNDPDVLLIDATGRDHPRRAGLALHLGALLDRPSVGVTDRPLLAVGDAVTDPRAGSISPLVLGDELVAASVRTRSGVRPLVAHAAWRTDVSSAVEVVRRTATRARTPEPLRVARSVAREARARSEREHLVTET
jgi:deoxyribonuclease V